MQGTYDGVDNYFHLDTVDIRYAQETSLFDEDMTLGLSLNNNPTLAGSIQHFGCLAVSVRDNLGQFGRSVRRRPRHFASD